MATSSSQPTAQACSFAPPLLHAGRLPEAERDQIEVQLGAYMKNCNESIARLQASASPRGTPAAAASQAAHQLGVVGQPPHLQLHPQLAASGGV